MHADLSFSYLRFAEAASFDKEELRRSCTGPVRKVFDEGRYFTWGSGGWGGGAGNLEFFGPQIALAYRLVQFHRGP